MLKTSLIKTYCYMTEEKLENINKLNERILNLKSIIKSCEELKKSQNIQWIMKSDYNTYHYGKPIIDIVLGNDEMRLMDKFLDKLIQKKNKELKVFLKEFSRY